jgi:quinoprotein relay system zinc metallohydrolase 2
MVTRRALLSGVVGLALQAHATRGETPFILSEAAPGIRVHVPLPALVARANEGDIANLSVIIGSEACAVVDTGGSPAVGTRFRKAIAALTTKPIKYVINTHTHPDHIFGNMAFQADGVIFVGHHNLPRALASRAEHYLTSYRKQLGDGLMAGFRFVPPTLLVEDELALDLGGRNIRLKAWPPAHTDCDLTVFDETTETFFTGDLIFREHVPVLDGSLLGWLKVMDGLAGIKAKRAIPGHGTPDPAWPRSLAAHRSYFETLAADLRKDIRLGVPLAKAAQTAAAAETRNWQLFDDYNGRNASQAYRELEWE